MIFQNLFELLKVGNHLYGKIEKPLFLSYHTNFVDLYLYFQKTNSFRLTTISLEVNWYDLGGYVKNPFFRKIQFFNEKILLCGDNFEPKSSEKHYISFIKKNFWEFQHMKIFIYNFSKNPKIIIFTKKFISPSSWSVPKCTIRKDNL